MHFKTRTTEPVTIDPTTTDPLTAEPTAAEPAGTSQLDAAEASALVVGPEAGGEDAVSGAIPATSQDQAEGEGDAAAATPAVGLGGTDVTEDQDMAAAA